MDEFKEIDRADLLSQLAAHETSIREYAKTVDGLESQLSAVTAERNRLDKLVDRWRGEALDNERKLAAATAERDNAKWGRHIADEQVANLTKERDAAWAERDRLREAAKPIVKALNTCTVPGGKYVYLVPSISVEQIHALSAAASQEKKS